MTKTILLLIVTALLSFACARHKTGGPPQQTTHTIAPASAQPTAQDGTDAVTQTVDIDDSRSESDGMASATTTRNAPKKAPAKKKGRK